jgi:hypothetical protein
MDGLLAIDDLENAGDEVVPAEVRELAQALFAAEMGFIEGIAAGAAKRALLGDLNGE